MSKTIGVIIFNYELPSLIDVEEGKKETARKLLEKEITMETVEEITGLTKEEITENHKAN